MDTSIRENILSLHHSVQIWISYRRENISSLEEVADKLDTMQVHYDRSQVAARAMSVGSGTVSSVMFIAGVLTGGVAFIPATVGAGVVGISSLIVSKGADVGKWLREEELVERAQQALNKDCDETKKLLKVVAEELDRTTSFHLNQESRNDSIEKIVAIMKFAKSPDAIVNGVDSLGNGTLPYQSMKCKKLSNIIKTSKLGKAIKISSGVLGIALTVIDLGYLIKQSVELHNGSYNAAAREIRQLARTKEKELRKIEEAWSSE